MKKETESKSLSEKRRKAALARWGVGAPAKTISIRCDVDAAELVKAEAAKRKIRASALVAEAIRTFFKR